MGSGDLGRHRASGVAMVQRWCELAQLQSVWRLHADICRMDRSDLVRVYIEGTRAQGYMLWARLGVRADPHYLGYFEEWADARVAEAAAKDMLRACKPYLNRGE